LDESGRLPFAYDEKEKVYKAVQATQIFTSPVKQNKEFDDEDGDDVRDLSSFEDYIDTLSTP